MLFVERIFMIYMIYNKYKKLINDALIEYFENGGSLVYLALHDLNKEYIFEFDEPIPENEKEILIDNAIKAIEEGKDLPENIELVNIIIEQD